MLSIIFFCVKGKWNDDDDDESLFFFSFFSYGEFWPQLFTIQVLEIWFVVHFFCTLSGSLRDDLDLKDMQ